MLWVIGASLLPFLFLTTLSLWLLWSLLRFCCFKVVRCTFVFRVRVALSTLLLFRLSFFLRCLARSVLFRFLFRSPLFITRHRFSLSLFRFLLTILLKRFVNLFRLEFQLNQVCFKILLLCRLFRKVVCLLYLKLFFSIQLDIFSLLHRFFFFLTHLIKI